MEFTGKIFTCDEPTDNHRTYSRELVEEMIEKVQPLIDAGALYGQADQGQSLSVETAEVSHRVTSIEIDDSGNVLTTVKVLETPQGDIIKALLEQGVKMDLRTRGSGNVDLDTGMISDYELSAIDFVPNQEPSDVDLPEAIVLDQEPSES